MATRVVEGKKPYTGGKAISIDENKVISLNLRDENNLIIYDEGDDEIYVDLQLPDGIEPTDAFPVGVTTGRAVVADGWDKAGTIISAKTTSGDEIKILYADDGTLWIDNGTGTFKQIYFKADVDAIVQAIWNYIHANVNTKTFYLASDQDLTTAQAIYDWWEAGNNPIIIYNNQSYSLYREVQGVIEFFENTPHAMTIWNDRTALVHHNIGIYEINDQIHLDITLNYSSLGDACFLSTEVNYTTPYTPQYAGSPATKAYVDSHSGDVLVSDQANNIFTPGMKIWGGTESDYQSLTPDSNTAYLLLAGGPTPPSPQWEGDFSKWQQVQQINAPGIWSVGVSMKPDGTILYVEQGSKIKQYALSTAFDLATATSTGEVSINCEGIFFKPDGSKLYTVNNYIYQYDLTTPRDVTTATNMVTGPNLGSRGVYITPDGTTVFSCDGYSDFLYSQTLSTPRDLSTADGNTVTQNGGQGNDLRFGDEGKIYISQRGESTQNLTYKYLATPYELSSVTSTGDINIGMLMATGLRFNPTGTICITSGGGSSTNYIRKYTLS